MSLPLPWLAFLTLAAVTLRAEQIDFVWPTPSRAWARGHPLEEFIQPTASGQPQSGTFGCVRSGGRQFHEGLDIRPVARDRQGEPADPVFAALPGVVRYVNSQPGRSNYGRYVVLEHPDLTPAVYTLYAHLAGIAPGLDVGTRVPAGQTLGRMGRSASGPPIPRERAHLHFEIGLRATDRFDRWYASRQSRQPNFHGNFHGQNLLGLDPLDFLRRWRLRQGEDFSHYLRQRVPAVRVRVASPRVPDFIQRYPSLLRQPLPAGPIGGWEVDCDWTGLPFAWTPLTPLQVVGLRPDSVQVLGRGARLAASGHPCRQLVRQRGDRAVPGPDLIEILQLVFGLE